MIQQEKPQIQIRRNRRTVGVALSLVGLFVFIIGAKPEWFGLDGSIAIGFVQMGVFSFGLVLICLGGTISIDSLWKNGYRSIVADLGLRLAWTGLIVALISALADLIGVGTRPFPEFQIFFGFWQARGIMIGQMIMIVGFLMMIPYKPMSDQKEKSEEES